ncbi:MAG: hypothetical protein ACI865_002355 [Flavobacteriaceae bacterium]|jgi:hypothetical protein
MLSKRSFFSVFIFSVFSFTSLAGGGGCTAISNISCATATTLTPGDPCTVGSSCSGGSTGAGACLYTGECAWYEFTATAATMYINIDHTAGGCHMSSAVYEQSGGSCSMTEISCQSGTPLDDLHSFTSLSVGTTYYIEICYGAGGPCGDAVDYCIEVGEPDPPCDDCSTPCGTAEGYLTAPTVATVVADCQTSPFIPELQAGSTNTFCYTFTAGSTSVDFNVIITSNCGGGNVTNFSWELDNHPCSGGLLQSGDLSSLTFSPVVVGNDYVFCYTFDVPAGCTHSQHCPFFVGALPLLPIELSEFNAEAIEDGSVVLNWITESESDNDYFTIERTQNGILFEEVGVVPGAGTTSEESSYRLVDPNPLKGISYYRLMQTDMSGSFEYSSLVSVEVLGDLNHIVVIPNPIDETGFFKFDSKIKGSADFIIRDLFGREVLREEYAIDKGLNEISLDAREFGNGVYIVTIAYDTEIYTVKFVKK